MAQKHVLIHEIIEDHNDRMLNLKRYYPFFKLQENVFIQYKEGKYSELDMGYILMATLRYFIHENNFNEKDVTYFEYEEFISELLNRDFSLIIDKNNERELIKYIFDKIKNDGKPFEFTYFDPVLKCKKTARIKLLDAKLEGEIVYYHITSDAIEFYLDTKEIKDESKISIQQLLLEKMINSNNFKGGIDVVRRINNEVSKLIYKKKEVIRILSYDVFEGSKACEEYMQTVAKWFSEEQKLFSKNKELIETALKKVELDASTQHNKQKFYKSLEEINSLEIELKKAINKHGELIRETMELQNASDQIISSAKFKKLRPVFDFKEVLIKIEAVDNPRLMGDIFSPLFEPSIIKSFPLFSIDNMLTYKPQTDEESEKIPQNEANEEYVYEDEVEEQRIDNNFEKLVVELFNQIMLKGKINLRELNGIYEIKFGKEILVNGDYYSFLVHISQKKEYLVDKLVDSQDTFFEGIIAEKMSGDIKKKYEGLKIRLIHDSEDEIELLPGFKVSNIIFERIN